MRKGSASGLRIGLDMISAGSGFHPGAGGMISYYQGLLGALAAHPEVERVTAFVSPWNDGLAIPDRSKVRVQPCSGLPDSRVGRVAYEQAVLPLLARRRRVDALVSTVNVMPLLRREPTVVVLQSIQGFMWPEELGRLRRAYMRFAVPRSLKKADAVITVTETERRDALGLFDADPSRLVTVYHGASDWAQQILEASELPDPFVLPGGMPYVLAVSRLYGFKNHSRLIRGFALARRERRIDDDLVIAGGDADVTRSDLESLALEEGVAEHVHCMGMVPQAELPGLFSGSSAVAYVSLYETFGHPILEAFAFGLPLVTSASGATAEVAGGAARLVDPGSVQSIADGLSDVLADQALRKRLAEAGRLRVAEFSWERCAQGTVDAIKGGLARRGRAAGDAAIAPRA